jgi:hypothetical protein
MMTPNDRKNTRLRQRHIVLSFFSVIFSRPIVLTVKDALLDQSGNRNAPERAYLSKAAKDKSK